MTLQVAKSPKYTRNPLIERSHQSQEATDPQCKHAGRGLPLNSPFLSSEVLISQHVLAYKRYVSFVKTLRHRTDNATMCRSLSYLGRDLVTLSFMQLYRPKGL